MDELAKKIQAFLYNEGGSLSMRRLATLTGEKGEALKPALAELSAALTGSGLSLVATDTEVTLAASAETSTALQTAYEKELGNAIGEAGLEVLAIVLYRGASTRAQIDYIRGVNTSSTIRTLLSRGLVERTGNPEDGREYLYRPTTELLAHLGVHSSEELPQYVEIKAELAAFESHAATETSHE